MPDDKAQSRPASRAIARSFRLKQSQLALLCTSFMHPPPRSFIPGESLGPGRRTAAYQEASHPSLLTSSGERHLQHGSVRYEIEASMIRNGVKNGANSLNATICAVEIAACSWYLSAPCKGKVEHWRWHLDALSARDIMYWASKQEIPRFSAHQLAAIMHAAASGPSAGVVKGRWATPSRIWPSRTRQRATTCPERRRERALSRMPFLFGTVTAQACTEAICLPPADLKLPRG